MLTSLPNGNDGTYDSIETGDMLFFDADTKVLAVLDVTSLSAQNALMGKTDDLNDDVEKPVLAVGVSCSRQMLRHGLESAFNGSVVESSSSGAAGDKRAVITGSNYGLSCCIGFLTDSYFTHS